jgi:tRNA(Arg) A34 adenosine deaminase TadA
MNISARLENRMKSIVDNNLHKITATHRHFSFIVRKARIIAWGYNKTYKTHTIANRFGHRFNDIHAELHVLTRFPYPLRKLHQYDLYNVRVRRIDGTFALAKPCVYCSLMLAAFGISQVFYTNETGGWSN